MDLNSLRNELETVSESLKTEIDSNESEIMKQLRGDICQGVESLRGEFEKTAKKQVSNDELQQKLDDLNNKFQEDVERNKRIIIRIKAAAEEELT